MFASIHGYGAAAAKADITGLDRPRLIQALYQRSQVLGMGAFQFDRGTISDQEARKLVGTYMDYLHGKVMKIKVPAPEDGNEIETALYNRDNGVNAAEEVIASLRKKASLNKAAAAEGKPADPPIATLIDGTPMPAALALLEYSRLLSLFTSGDISNMLAVYELRELVRNPKHQIFGNLGKVLRAKELVTEEGTVQTHIQHLVRAAIVGESLDMTLRDPFQGGIRSVLCESGLEKE